MSKSYLILDTPESCLDCPITSEHGEFTRSCLLIKSQVPVVDTVFDEKVGANFPEGYIYERHPDCPLKPLGKLIDADVLVERINKTIKNLDPETPHENGIVAGLITAKLIASKMAESESKNASK